MSAFFPELVTPSVPEPTPASVTEPIPSPVFEQAPVPVSTPSFSKKFLFFALAAIVLAGVLVYASSLNGAFLWDDQHLIQENPLIKNVGNAAKLFQGNILAGHGKDSQAYRPVQMLSYMVDYRLWRLDPRGYHATSVLWHLLAALCVFALALRLTSDRLLALFAGLLFVVHPIHTEAVSYISGRSDPLAAVFLLCAFIAYIDTRPGRTVLATVGTVVFYAAALLSREASLVLPVLLLAYHGTFRKKMDENRFMSLVVVSGLYIFGRAVAVRDLLSSPANAMTFVQRATGFFAALAQYIGKLLWPSHLHMEYGLPRLPFTDVRVALGVIFLAALVLIAWRTAARHKSISFSIQWFLITLLPVSNLFPINAYMAEHWLYLPSVGIFLLAAGGLSVLGSRRGTRPAAFIGLAVLWAVSSLLTVRQNATWRDPRLFYERTLRYAPGSIRALVNLANIYKEIGRDDEAVLMYNKALEARPDHAMALSNLANIYRERGQAEEAEALYSKAMEVEPDFELSYNNQGNVYEDAGDRSQAILMYKKAIEINPQYAGSYYNLANVYQDIGEGAEAIVLYEKAVTLNPEFADAHNNLGNAYKNLGDVEKAIEAYESAIAVRADFLEAHNNLGTAYLRQGRHEEARAELEKTIALQPDYGVAYVNLAVVAYDAGEYETAIKHVDTAQALGVAPHPGFLGLLEPYRQQGAQGRDKGEGGVRYDEGPEPTE